MCIFKMRNYATDTLSLIMYHRFDLQKAQGEVDQYDEMDLKEKRDFCIELVFQWRLFNQREWYKSSLNR